MTCLVMFFGQNVMQLNIYGLYLKLMLTFRCTFIFVCIIVSLFLSVFLPVWRNKGVHIVTVRILTSKFIEFEYANIT